MLQCVCQQLCPTLNYDLCSEPKTMALNITQETALRNKTFRMKPGKGKSYNVLFHKRVGKNINIIALIGLNS